MKIKKMGFVYGRIIAHLPDDFATAGRYNIASQLPLTGITQAILEFHKLGMVNPILEEEIAEFYSTVKQEDTKLQLNAQQQSDWVLGYYQGKSADTRPHEGANRLKFYREKNGMEQRELAKKIGVEPNYISDLEVGRRDIKRIYASTVAKMAEALGVKSEDLM